MNFSLEAFKRKLEEAGNDTGKWNGLVSLVPSFEVADEDKAALADELLKSATSTCMNNAWSVRDRLKEALEHLGVPYEHPQSEYDFKFLRTPAQQYA